MGLQVQLLSLSGDTWKQVKNVFCCFFRNETSPVRSIANKGGIQVSLSGTGIFRVGHDLAPWAGTTRLKGLCLHHMPMETSFPTSRRCMDGWGRGGPQSQTALVVYSPGYLSLASEW